MNFLDRNGHKLEVVDFVIDYLNRICKIIQIEKGSNPVFGTKITVKTIDGEWTIQSQLELMHYIYITEEDAIMYKLST